MLHHWNVNEHGISQRDDVIELNQCVVGENSAKQYKLVLTKMLTKVSRLRSYCLQ